MRTDHKQQFEEVLIGLWSQESPGDSLKYKESLAQTLRFREKLRSLFADDPRAPETLAAIVTDRSSPARVQAAVVLSEIKDARAVDALMTVFVDKSETSVVRQCAAEALGESGATRALGPLTSAFKADGNSLVREAAGTALARLNDPGATRTLLAALCDGGAEISATSTIKTVVDSLAYVRTPAAVQVIVAGLKHDSWLMKKVAKRALNNWSAVVRVAWSTLGDTRDRGGVEVLIQAMDDEDADVRTAADAALTTITAKSFFWGGSRAKWQQWWADHKARFRRDTDTFSVSVSRSVATGKGGCCPSCGFSYSAGAQRCSFCGTPRR